MENYFENHKKYNKILFKYLGYGKDIDYSLFTPEDHVSGFEILRWVMHKINHNPKEGKTMRIIISMKDVSTEVFIQEWYDTTKSDGFINIVAHKELCEYKKDEVSDPQFHQAVLETSHKATYNACVDYIIKTS